MSALSSNSPAMVDVNRDRTATAATLRHQHGVVGWEQQRRIGHRLWKLPAVARPASMIKQRPPGLFAQQVIERAHLHSLSQRRIGQHHIQLMQRQIREQALFDDLRDRSSAPIFELIHRKQNLLRDQLEGHW